MSEPSFLFSQPTEIQVTLAAWQAFRNLGFPSDNIFVGLIDEKIIIAVRNFEQKNVETHITEFRNFSISVGSSTMEKEKFEMLWTEMVQKINEIPELELKLNYKKIITKAMLVKLVMILHNNKISVPYMEDFRDKNSN